MRSCNRYSDEDVIREAEILISGNYSTYELSRKIGIPNSTLWWHMAIRLDKVDTRLAIQAREVLKEHCRGRGRI